MHIYKINSTIIPQKERVKFAGTNLGDMLGPVKFQAWQNTWKLSPDAKKELYRENRREVVSIVYRTIGCHCLHFAIAPLSIMLPSHIPEVGGRNPGDDSDEDSCDGLDLDEQQPVFTKPGNQSAVVQPVHWHQFDEDTNLTHMSSTICNLWHADMVSSSEHQR